MKTHKPLFFSGDWHGRFDSILYDLKHYGIEDATIIQVGDFGIGFDKRKVEKKKLKEFAKSLAKLNITLYAIRGNHDDPAYFTGEAFGCITLLKDYSVLEVNAKRILCVGGAISIDRKPNKEYPGRFEGIDYWSNENVVLDEKALEMAGAADIIVTHSSPFGVFPYTLKGKEDGWYETDAKLYDDIHKERTILTHIYDSVSKKGKVEHYFYGHYHLPQLAEMNGTKFRCLGIDEFYELRG